MRQTSELFAEAEREGMRVEWRDLGTISGGYNDRTRTIVLHTKLTQYQQLSTLAHELSHARWGDTVPIVQADYDRMERRADAEAARMLISCDDYARAEAEVGPHPGALADYLGVSLWVVEAWRREAAHGRDWVHGVAGPAPAVDQAA